MADKFFIVSKFAEYLFAVLPECGWGGAPGGSGAAVVQREPDLLRRPHFGVIDWKSRIVRQVKNMSSHQQEAGTAK
ncbi:MAG: hypothetical protein AB1425_16315 [Actinomycetota bacterium]